jgi:predicted MPP superfamily phosphohydrolase
MTWSREPLDEIGTLLGRRGAAPAIAVLGNHDHIVDAAGTRARLEATGIAVLQNENTHLRLRGESLAVVGIDDGATHHDDAGRALRGSDTAPSRLVLTHSPPTVRKLPPGKDLLCLSGHTHGGAVMVPPLTPLLFRLAGQPYVRGAYAVGGNRLYVNRGLGMGPPSHHPRLHSRPELTVFTLSPAEAQR